MSSIRPLIPLLLAAGILLGGNGLQSTLIALRNIFPDASVYGKCEFLAPSGCFKIRGATHLLEHLARRGGARRLVVPSMGNTALGAATAAREFGFAMTGVVPQTIHAVPRESVNWRCGISPDG